MPKVLDASVCINLASTQHGKTVLSYQQDRIVIPDAVAKEVAGFRDSDGKLSAHPLLDLIEVVTLDRQAISTFFRLVTADPRQCLDDGEAAAVALTEKFGGEIFIDEKKGRRIAGEIFGESKVCCSVDLFRDAEKGGLNTNLVNWSIFEALRDGRMRVLPDDEAWVRNRLTAGQIALCPSLKKRKKDKR
jgi:predicted nucleic acid-binding protein